MADSLDSKDDSEDETLEYLREKRPTLANAIWFWTWHILSWAFYILLSLVYIPWALAMHIVLLVLVGITAPALYWRIPRKIHLYVYVILVMVPGKFLWYNLWRFNKRKAQIWDYEMGRPKPVEIEKRRRLSEGKESNPQLDSPFFAKLPPEVRQKIYEHIILANSHWLTIMGWEKTEPKRAKNIKLRAYPSNMIQFKLTEDPASFGGRPMKEIRVHVLKRDPDDPDKFVIGLPLLQTCRRIYKEAIELYYNVPSFCFKDLHRPPYFLQTVLPERLALIRSLNLIYDQSNMVQTNNHVACSTAKFQHKIGKCHFCNPLFWFTGIKKYMTGLQEIVILIRLTRKQRIPDMGKLWISRMFDLQKGPHGLRQMHIAVTPIIDATDEERVLMFDEEEFINKTAKFHEELQTRLRRGVESYMKHEQMHGKATIDGREIRRPSEVARAVTRLTRPPTAFDDGVIQVE